MVIVSDPILVGYGDSFTRGCQDSVLAAQYPEANINFYHSPTYNKLLVDLFLVALYLSAEALVEPKGQIAAGRGQSRP